MLGCDIIQQVQKCTTTVKDHLACLMDYVNPLSGGKHALSTWRVKLSGVRQSKLTKYGSLPLKGLKSKYHSTAQYLYI